MKGNIYITLKSDLCAASGDGFSLSIDTDVCADKYGFPFIPSRRIKGCLREAAEFIGCKNIDRIFGVSGNDRSGSLKLMDARLEGYGSLIAQAKQSGCTAEKVLSLFTSVRASTAIENDTAKENSLRFMRVVDHYSPLDDNELVFVSQVECSNDDKECLERICKALRNIGYKRSRGFGSVICRFKTADEQKADIPEIPGSDEEYTLSYTIRLDSPLMLAGKSSIETLDYVPGTTVLGAFASQYLRSHSDDERFEELFLKGGLTFSNLYISEGKTIAEPAPAVLGKLKDSKVIKYIFREDNPKGDTIKAFKNGWLIGTSELKPEKETIYHNGKKQGEENDKILYTQECLCEGQLFSGNITGSGKTLRELIPALESGSINIGRSKSAQYSSCTITAMDISKATSVPTVTGELYALLCSDVLLLDENADYTTDIYALARELGIEPVKEHSALKYKTVMGYVSVGRYKKTHVRAFEKGSVICFKTDKPMPKMLIIGERTNEGFGVVKLFTKEELMQLGSIAPKMNDSNKASDSRLLVLIDKNKKEERLKASAIDFANKEYKNVENIFTSSFVGRLLLMTKQSRDKNNLSDKNDLDERVASVKDDKKRKAAQEFIKNAEECCDDKDILGFIDIALTIVKYKLKGKDKTDE